MERRTPAATWVSLLEERAFSSINPARPFLALLCAANFMGSSGYVCLVGEWFLVGKRLQRDFKKVVQGCTAVTKVEPEISKQFDGDASKIFCTNTLDSVF